MELDVLAAASFKTAESVIHEVVDAHGRIDVLVNNAGRTQVGALEETTEDELRHLFELHFFGPAALTRAALPHSAPGRRHGRADVVRRRAGDAVGFGVYAATKFALDGLTETLVDEVPDVRFVIVEHSASRTNLFDSSAAVMSTAMPEYDDTVGPTREFVTTAGGSQPGDPSKAAAAIHRRRHRRHGADAAGARGRRL